MSKKKQMSDVERAILHKRRLIVRWKGEQDEWKAQAEEECRILQKKIDREAILIQALERGELKPCAATNQNKSGHNQFAGWRFRLFSRNPSENYVESS